MSDSYDFAVRRDDMRETSVLETPGADREIDEGQILLEVDHFSLTANNVTYGAMGEAMNYWDFYPAEDDSLGRIPAWGYADVVVSKAEGIEEGARVFGGASAAEPVRSITCQQPDLSQRLGIADHGGPAIDAPAPHRQHWVGRHTGSAIEAIHQRRLLPGDESAVERLHFKAATADRGLLHGRWIDVWSNRKNPALRIQRTAQNLQTVENQIGIVAQ